MQFKVCVMAALATAVSAQLLTADPAAASVLLQLATALPPSILAVAATNQAGFASEIASSIQAGNTPAWYEALPTDVKAALASIYPISTPAYSTPSETAAPSVSSSAELTTVTEVTETSVEISVTVITSVPESSLPSGTGASSIGSNSTAVTSVNTPTLAPSNTEGGSSPSQSSFPGAASFPSAAVGAGIAGALSFLGMLVL